MLANSKIARQVESKAFNPEYVFTTDTEAFSIGEVSAPIVAFGSFEDGSVERDLVEYFFRKPNMLSLIRFTFPSAPPQAWDEFRANEDLVNERLPTELGWSRKEAVVNIEDILKASKFIRDATSLFTDSESGHGSKRDLHSGFNFQA